MLLENHEFNPIPEMKEDIYSNAEYLKTSNKYTKNEPIMLNSMSFNSMNLAEDNQVTLTSEKSFK